jgi:ABC-type polysaccharide transport system permease subunit
LWKSLGWSAIIYIAAVSSIDQELYEAARVDGAGRFRLMWNITLPGLMSTYMVLLLLSVANFLNVGFEQFYVFRNPFNTEFTTILDLYVYDLAFPITGASNYPLSVAVGMLKSIISVTLLFIVNSLSRRLRGDSII